MMEVQELVDLTIDFLHDSRADLKRCILVCRSWHPPAQHHLFSSYVLQNEIDCRRLSLLPPRIFHLITHLILAFHPNTYGLLATIEFTHLRKLSIYSESLPSKDGLAVMQHLVTLPSIMHISMHHHDDDAQSLSLFLLRTEKLGTLEISPWFYLNSHGSYDDEKQLAPSPATRCTVECLIIWDHVDVPISTR
ncbi:hypothetical protein DFH09DRAFT_330474 [Mycena vulgaris]|nr:hypothetical protein DFH09DRAFT_330474 [Mycena vulgaris]